MKLLCINITAKIVSFMYKYMRDVSTLLPTHTRSIQTAQIK